MDHSETKHYPKVDHTPAELDEISRTLLKAANIIEERGWCQGAAGYLGPNYCVGGAIHMAIHGEINFSIAFDPALIRLKNALGMSPISWNDTVCRSQAEAIAKLRAVALGFA